MIKIFKNRNNIFNIGKRTRKYTAKINSGNAIGTFINNSIVETKKRGAQRRGEEAREQRENERKKKEKHHNVKQKKVQVE